MATSRQLPLPRVLLVELTSYCNLKCVMCPKTNHSVNTEESRVMSWEVFDKLTPLLPDLQSMDLTGIWGEAFLHPDLYMKMLKHAKQHNVAVHTTSNATLITDDIARQLVETWLDRLIVSVDAATPETYSKIRPPGKHDNVIAALERIQKWKQDLKSPNPRVDLAFVGMRWNIKEFPDVVRLGHKFGVEQIALQAMGEYPGLEDLSVARNHKKLGKRIYQEAKDIGDEVGVDVVLFPPDQFEEDRQDLNRVEDFNLYRKDCRELWTKAAVAATGDILTCCSCKRPLGNLKTQSFEEIWHSKAYNTYRRQILSNKPPAMCQRCTGIAWVRKSDRRDRDFFRTLLPPSPVRRLWHYLRRYALARWAKRHLDRLRGRNV